MSDLAATNCGCGEERCGCDNGCGCGNSREVSNYGNNSCCNILWIIILLIFCGNNGSNYGYSNGYGNSCGSGDCCWIIIILLLLCGGCGNGNGCGFGF